MQEHVCHQYTRKTKALAEIEPNIKGMVIDCKIEKIAT
jgi:hypothetical protein